MKTIKVTNKASRIRWLCQRLDERVVEAEHYKPGSKMRSRNLEQAEAIRARLKEVDH